MVRKLTVAYQDQSDGIKLVVVVPTFRDIHCPLMGSSGFLEMLTKSITSITRTRASHTWETSEKLVR
jgi:hypothetical protein